MGDVESLSANAFRILSSRASSPLKPSVTWKPLVLSHSESVSTNPFPSSA